MGSVVLVLLLALTLAGDRAARAAPASSRRAPDDRAAPPERAAARAAPRRRPRSSSSRDATATATASASASASRARARKSAPARDKPVAPARAREAASWDEAGNPAEPPRGQVLPEPSAPPGVKRPRPDYDGRGDPPLSAGDVLIWIPRSLLFPLYLTMEYVVGWPLVKLLNLLERHHLIERARRFFLFHDERGLILPTVLQDLGRFRAIGVYVRYRDLGFEGHNVLGQVGFWSDEWVELTLKDKLDLFRRDRARLITRFHFRWRPDTVFHGVGYDTVQEAKSFYRVTETDLELTLRAALWDLNRLRLSLRYRNVRIEGGQSPSVDAPTRARYWDAEALPGFGEHYNLLSARAQIRLDSRNPLRNRTHGSGVRLMAFGSYSRDPGDEDLHFANWGGELATFWDVTGENHVLALRAYLEAQETLGSRPVPIHHRVTLGGNERLRGFVKGRYRGDSAFVLSLQYRYPIWWLVDASLFVSVGNVFSGRFTDFAYERLVASWGLGVRTNNSRNVSFDLLIAFGSNLIGQWPQGFELQHVRLVVGINHGF
jgi:hypothetical protein